MHGNLENTGRLVRFILRRERVVSTVWVGIVAVLSALIAPYLSTMFTSEGGGQSIETMTEMLKNPAMVAMMGPVYGADAMTVGAMYAVMMMQWLFITVGVMNIFLVVRHTRGDEELGRAEVVRSLPTGRLTKLHAAMIVAVIVNASLGLLTGLFLAAMRVESMGFAGSMLYGAALGVAGLLFAAVAALFSQLCSTTRGAIGFSFLVMGVFYLMRAAGDMGTEALSLASPMGLLQRSQVYVENHGWPVLIVLLETVVVAAAAYALNAVRDMGQGFIPVRPGRKEAGRSLLSPLGLSVRLLRNTMIAWFFGMFALSAAYGSIMKNIDEFVAQNEMYRTLIGQSEGYSTAEMFTVMINTIMSLMCVVPVAMAVLKLRGEEKEGRAEHVLSRAVPRGKLLAGYVLIAFVTSAAIQLANAVGLYASASASLGNTNTLRLSLLLKADLAYLPAIWVMLGIVVLLVGVAPRATGAIWAYFGISFFLVYFGRVITGMPEWIKKLSPFGHIPQLPVESVNYVTLGVMTLTAAILTAAGFVGYAKRDVSG